MSEDSEVLKASTVERAKNAKIAKKAAEDVKSGPKVAEGKSLTSLRGIIGPGQIVTEADFKDGKATIEKFVKSGHLVK